MNMIKENFKVWNDMKNIIQQNAQILLNWNIPQALDSFIKVLSSEWSKTSLL